MVVEVIDYGGRMPDRSNYNDSGADVFAQETRRVSAGMTEKIKLGIGLKIPDGHDVTLRPRSGLSAKGIIVALGTIDAGYEGEISAVVSNISGAPFVVKAGMKLAQIVVTPVVYCEFVDNLDRYKKRGSDGFGSTGI